jgi:capsular exopolysaccharide synthesis family protein
MSKSVRYSELKRDLETRRAVYDSMLKQVKEAGVVSALQASNVHIVDPAVAPDTPVRPNKLMYSAIGLAAGSLFGLVFIYGREKRAPRPVPALPKKTEHNVRQLGAVPFVPSEPENLHAGSQPALGASDSLVELTAWRHPNSGATESFRKVLQHLLYSTQRATRPRVISVTSASHGEGRTFVTCNLATALAQSGRKVLVIDADRMHPRIHEIFGVSNESGFTDLILQQAAKSSDTVWSTGLPNLFVAPGGHGMARLASLTHDPRLSAVLDRLCAHFDMILLDTPPVFSDGDAVAIGQHADGVLIVQRPEQASREMFEASVEQCLQHGLPVIGKIVNSSEASLHALAS